jgi:predicted RNA methylase
MRAAAGLMKLSARQQELLRVIRVTGNVAVFDSTERIPDWPTLKKVMVALGGTWNRKGFAFHPDVDAAELVRCACESGEIIDPKAADFYPTPKALAKLLVQRAGIKDGDRVLEPSAGTGAIVSAVFDQVAAQVTCVEILEENCQKPTWAAPGTGIDVRRGDFLEFTKADLGDFDAIVMNPPFSKRADIAHVLHAIGFLRPHGRLAAIMSAGVEFRDDKLGTDFRAKVAALRGTIARLPDGSFRESGTMVRTVMVTLTKGAK